MKDLSPVALSVLRTLWATGAWVEGSRPFPVGFDWPDLVLWLETDMKRRVERMRVQPGLSARKQWKGSRAPVWCAYGRLHPVVWLPSSW